MSFLSDFDFETRSLIATKKTTTKDKYWEDETTSTNDIQFEGIISEEKKQNPYALDTNKNLISTIGKYVLRYDDPNIDLKKGDKITDFEVDYEIEYVMPGYWEWKKDHMYAILKLDM